MTTTFALFSLVAFLVMHEIHFKLGDERTWSNRFNLLITAIGVLLVSVAVWLTAIRNSQLAPHHITQSLNGKIINEFWATNPAYITYSTELRAGLTNGYYCQVPHTNYYWHIWKCFQK